MAIVVKEIEVNTTVEKRVIHSESISEELYDSLKKRIMEDIQSQEQATQEERRRRER